jgi:hypothetical protein
VAHLRVSKSAKIQTCITTQVDAQNSCTLQDKHIFYASVGSKLDVPLHAKGAPNPSVSVTSAADQSNAAVDLGGGDGSSTPVFLV